MSGNWYDDGDLYQGDEYVGPPKYEHVIKTCKRCDREISMSSDHGICDSCAGEIERGWEY